jgi:inositol transport system substrate-binding protein
MKYLLPAFSAFLLCGVIASCNNKKQGLTIGISYQNLQNEFIINLQDAVRKKAKELNITLIEADGQGKAENQISQVENFISQGVDAIILNPFDRNGSAPAVIRAVEAKTPVVVMNAIVSNLSSADAYVGSDDYEAGRIAAQKIADTLHGSGNVVIIHGALSHSAEIQRTEGIKEILKKYPGIKVVFEQTANWEREKGLSLMENILSMGTTINAVIAQNDEMALGAYKAIEAAGKQTQVLVIGIDAIPDALNSVKEGKMVATVFQDAKSQGALSVELAGQLIAGKKIKHTNYIPFQLVTKENVSEFQR